MLRKKMSSATVWKCYLYSHDLGARSCSLYALMVVWHSGSVLVLISEVNLCCVLGLVIIGMGDRVQVQFLLSDIYLDT